MIQINKIHLGDCLELMKEIEDGSIDLILSDPPYGTIKNLINKERPKSWGNKDYNCWDEIINIDIMFKECNRILRKNGKLVLFSQEPYTNKLINKSLSNLSFDYKAVWLKDNFSNALLVNKAMVNYTEDILIFSKRHDTNALHPLREYGLKIKRYIKYSRLRLCKELNSGGAQHFLESNDESSQFCLCTKDIYNKLIDLYGFDKEDWFIEYNKLKRIDNEFKKRFSSIFNLWNGKRYKSNVLNYKKDYKRFHPTQKPLGLLKDLIKTFSNEKDCVLDFCCGSGSTNVACEMTKRIHIGIEKEKKFVDIANKRLKEVKIQTKL